MCDKERLRGTSHLTMVIKQVCRCQPNPFCLQVRRGIQADPWTARWAQDMQCQFRRHKLPGAKIESPAQAIGAIGDGDQVLDRRDELVRD